MREDLAERLLATVMQWSDEDVARERPLLQAFADYKFDEYEQYQPGRRFIESLAHWLDQLPSLDDRHRAYELVRTRLIFVSRAEMDYLVASVYPDIVRPRLIEQAAGDLGVPKHLVSRIHRDPSFWLRERRCLYIGLSDGARTAVLRRTTPRISNEQVVADYASLPQKAPGLLEDLRRDLSKRDPNADGAARFTTLVLLDDFSASGISYIRHAEPGKGKIAKLAKSLEAQVDLVDPSDLEVVIVLYVASTAARDYLRGEIPAFEETVGGRWRIEIVQLLPEEIVIRRGEDAALDGIIEQVYDPVINDEHMQKGRADGHYGFADCGLPVVLSHNTPNNSLAILWADTQKVRAVFPRVSRHKEDA